MSIPQPLISIIVPIYRVEQYLDACVQSLINQTYPDLEIILVDDGSPDNCGAICDDYAAKDPRIKVIHKENGGLSDARNAGMAISTGAYLSFVDSDDLLPYDALQVMVDIALRENVELVIGGHARFEEEPTAEAIVSGAVRLMNSEEAMADMLKNGCASWARLYRREIHIDIPFPKGEINEDEAIVLRILEKCSRVAITDTIVYHYRCRPESITTTNFSAKKLIWAKHCKNNMQLIQSRHPSLCALAADRYRGSLFFLLSEIALSDDDYTAQKQDLLSQLRRNSALFWKTPFSYGRDRIRMAALLYLPFGMFRWLVRMRMPKG